MLSNYNIYLNNIPEKGYTTIYNLLQKNLVCLQTVSIETENFTPTIQEKLANQGFWINKVDSDLNNVLLRYSNETKNSDTLNLTLILTKQCNFHCVYCYENHFNLSNSTFENIDLVIDFIKQKMKHYKKLVVTFFGGEPLLQKEKITNISTVLHNMFGSNYSFGLVTNGSLLYEEDAKQWVKLGFFWIKVTLDGQKQSHDVRRPLKSNGGTYDTIVSNLKAISKFNQIEIVILIIVDEEIFGIDKMVREIIDGGINAKFAISIKEPDNYPIESKTKILIDCAKQIIKEGGFLYSRICTNDGEICFAKKENTFTIDGEGNVFYCNGNLEKKVGKLPAVVNKPSVRIKDSCYSCKYLPICHSDCIFQKKCSKDFFDDFIPKWLSLFIKKSSE